MNLPARLKHIMILTGEPSGDMHGGDLIQQIKQNDPGIYVSGIGGPCLARENVDLFYSIDKLSVMGFTEIFMQLGYIKQAFSFFKKRLQTHLPDLIILVDYPGFNLKAAQYAKENYPVKILYYITPKVWAWKRSRIKKIKKYVDHAALILPFEEKIFKKANIPSTYVGNPLMDSYPETISKPFLRHNNLIVKEKGALIVGLLPGSRKTEVCKLLDVMAQTAARISHYFPKIFFIISKADSINKTIIETLMLKYSKQIKYKIYEGPVKDIFIESDMIIAASGTVTLEAALCCIPTIIIYKLSHISYRLARLLVMIQFAGLANLIMNRQVMPEFLQYEATAAKISKKAINMLNNLPFYENQLQGVRKRLGAPGASKRAARIAINMIRGAGY
ncbi:MAG: lipid-A-disaccharide synthase [Pseudomonadota bacterium]